MCIAVELGVGKVPVVDPWIVHGLLDMQRQIASFALELIHTSHMDFELRLEVGHSFCINSLTTFHFALLIVVAAAEMRRGNCLV